MAHAEVALHHSVTARAVERGEAVRGTVVVSEGFVEALLVPEAEACAIEGDGGLQVDAVVDGRRAVVAVGHREDRVGCGAIEGRSQRLERRRERREVVLVVALLDHRALSLRELDVDLDQSVER